jgi:multidrug efflux pump subunit AcrB
VVIGVTEAAQDISFKQMMRVQQSLADVIAQEPDVAGFVSGIGAGVGGMSVNNGRLFIALKPWDQRSGGTAQDFITRVRPNLQRVQGGALFLQAAQDIRRRSSVE